MAKKWRTRGKLKIFLALRIHVALTIYRRSSCGKVTLRPVNCEFHNSPNGREEEILLDLKKCWLVFSMT
jgi:hypothetical protein